MLSSKNYMSVHGLSAEEVERSRKEHGENTLPHKKKRGFFRQFLSNFGDPLIKILLVALCVNVVMLIKTADWYESVGIAVAVFLATFVSTLSEYGSEAAFEKMQAEAEQIHCRVIRDGALANIPIGEIVVGDFVLLERGERVPADGILHSGELMVNQAALNGESKEAEKKPGRRKGQWSLSAQHQLFRGSIVADGEGMMEVCMVGQHTMYGSMALEMQEETRESPLRVRLNHLAKILSRIGMVAAILVGFADLFHSLYMDYGMQWHQMLAAMQNLPWLIDQLLHALTLSITVVVVAVPEGLPMMITIVLSANMRRMLKDNVLVRKLVGIETSGSLNLLFSDKTGTITKGILQVSQFISGDGKEYASFQALEQAGALKEKVLLSSVFNSASSRSEGRALGGNATDRALLNWVLPAGAPEGYQRVSQIPFDSSRKFSVAEVRHGEERLYFVKGAPEKILDRCTRYLDAEGKYCPLSKEKIQKKWDALTERGMRVLALATSSSAVSEKGDFENLALLGLVGILDDLRPEAKGAIREIENAGIQFVMITGDNRKTAVSIASKLGIMGLHKEKAVLTSDEIAQMTDAQLSLCLKNIRVVARALPSDKSRLVRIAQEAGLVVGMTGDGMNDAPALKRADVGFAMGSGTEVAKEASDIVILDNNIASIAKAVLYGRTIFKSIRKFLVYQLTMNLCAVSVSIIGPFIGIDTPVTVMQMLWINIIMDTLAGMAFSGEPPLPEFMKEPPKRREEPVLNRAMTQQIFFDGIFTVALCLFFLCSGAMKNFFGYSQSQLPFLTAFFTLFIFSGVFNAFNARTPRINLFANLRKNMAFLFIMVSVILIQILMVYFGGPLFRTVGLSAREMRLTLLISMLILPADLMRKVFCSSWRKSSAKKTARRKRIANKPMRRYS